MSQLPSGTVTFLMTDIEGSTRLWEGQPDAMARAMDQHDTIIEDAVEENQGFSVRPRGEGDSRFAVFPRASDAVAAAADLQRGLAVESWPTSAPIRVRAALHTGYADLRLGDYYGSVVNRCARIRSLGFGGQTLLSMGTYELIKDEPLDDALSLRDLGEHRLKDLLRVEHVFQLDVAGLKDDFPSLKSIDLLLHNLPEQLTEFIGRESEVADLILSSRLVTILAPGGYGKTRLALHVAAEVVDGFPHGVYLVELAPISDSDAIGQAIASAIGLSLATDESAAQQIRNYLRARNALLITDNFDHLIDGAGLIGDLLEGAPGVRVLATSRVKLGLHGEATYAVGGLEVGELSSLEGVVRSDAGRLFLSEGRRAQPGFELVEGDLEPLGRLIRIVEGSPLAIVLAVSWVDVLSVTDIADEVAKSMDFLATDMQDLPRRQRSVRAVFDYSWRLLSEAEQTLFSSLSRFHGGFTRADAEAVAGAGLPQLSNLARKSLVTTTPESSRFAVHELLRQFGEEKLEASETSNQAVAEAHAVFYADLVAAAFVQVTAGLQRQALAEIEADIENVKAAWRWHVASGSPAQAARMVRGLWFVHDVRGWHKAAVELFGDAAAVARDRRPSDRLRVLIALCESAQGWFSSLLGAVDDGFELANRAVEVLREVGDPEDLQFALNQRSLGLYFTSQLEPLEANCREVLAVGDDKWMNVFAKCVLIFVSTAGGDLEEGERLAEDTRQLLGDVQDPWHLFWLQTSRSYHAMLRGDPAAARAILEETLDLLKSIDWRRAIQYTLANLGGAAMMLEDFASAGDYFLESLKVSEETGQLREMVGALTDIASALAADGRADEALALAATAFAHHASDQVTVLNQTPISERAEDICQSVSATNQADSAAWDRGLAANFDEVVSSLLEPHAANGR